MAPRLHADSDDVAVLVRTTPQMLLPPPDSGRRGPPNLLDPYRARLGLLHSRFVIRHSSLLYYYWEEVGHTTPWFGLVTGPRPLNTNFCTRLPSNVSVV